MPLFFMAYPNQTRLQVQIAIACGMTVAEAVKNFRVSKTAINCWLNPNRLKSQREACRNWKKADPDRARQANRKWYYSNHEQAREHARRSMKKWRINSPDKAKIRDRKSYEAQYARKPEYFWEKARRYQIKKQNFPMCEIEKMMCRNYYLMARELTEQTGTKHEVDHIWPISKGGPHLPWNLQVLTAEENRKKRDKI